MDAKLIDYARHLLSAGKTEEQVYAALMNNDGLSGDDVYQIIAEAKKAPVQPAEEERGQSPVAKPKKKWWPFK